MSPAIVWALIVLGGTAMAAGSVYLIITEPTFDSPPPLSLAQRRFAAAIISCAGLGLIIWTGLFSQVAR